MSEAKVINTCLIVEDHPQAQQWLCGAVMSAFPQAQVQSAATLAEARGLIEAPFDLALLDIGLPDGSGLDLVRTLVEHGAEVVISSTLTDDKHLFDALQRGAKGYVCKDHPQDQLRDMLLGILEGRPPPSPELARRVLDHFVGQPEDDPESILSNREREVLTLLAKGFMLKEVADKLGITYNTTAGYAKVIYRKLNVSNRAQATVEASRMGMI